MTDPSCPVLQDHVVHHEQIHVTAEHGRHAEFRDSINGNPYPCAIPGLNLSDYSRTPQQKGWPAPCVGPFTRVSLSSGAAVTVDQRINELVGLIMEANIRQGYPYRAADTGAYNCRHIASNPALPWSNHAWGLAIDCNWQSNPQHSPLITNRPGWEIQRWNRYGFAWGGDYTGSSIPDAMHVEFMGTPAQAAAATLLARAELGATSAGFLPVRKASPITGNPEIPGFDCSYNRPDQNAMAQAGYTFVIGYVSPTVGKNLTAQDMANYRAAGLGVGLVWEANPGRALEGAAAGTADGAAANQQADAIGYPTDAVIFFAVDVDTDASAYPAIQAYASAFNSATSRPVGVYGEADVLDQFVTPGQQPVQYGMQTAAWSGGRLSGKANLYQRFGHPAWQVPSGVPDTAFDEDVAIFPLPLFGWTAGVPAPTPTPPPVAPAPALNPNGAIAAVYNLQPQAVKDRLGTLQENERQVVNGGWVAVFAGGLYYWRADLGAFYVWGGILDAYALNGWEGGALGFPVSNEFTFQMLDQAGQLKSFAQSNFEHGFIVWDAATGLVTVRS